MTRLMRLTWTHDAKAAAATLDRLSARLSAALEAWEAHLAVIAAAPASTASPEALAALVAELGAELVELRATGDAEALAGEEWARRASLAQAAGRADLARQARQRQQEHTAHAARLALDALRVAAILTAARAAEPPASGDLPPTTGAAP
jgi:hypothetical protein